MNTALRKTPGLKITNLGDYATLVRWNDQWTLKMWRPLCVPEIWLEQYWNLPKMLVSGRINDPPYTSKRYSWAGIHNKCNINQSHVHAQPRSCSFLASIVSTCIFPRTADKNIRSASLDPKRRPFIKLNRSSSCRDYIDRPMIVQFTLIWRPENIICNMASGSLIGQSNNCLSLSLLLSSTFDERSSFRTLARFDLIIIIIISSLIKQRS